jgi:predicted phosphate transport protein (TIGR00153 family)
MARGLFGWFAPKRGENILKMVDTHLVLTQNAVNDLYKMVEASSNNLEEDTKNFFESVSQLEMRADALRRDMVEELTKSEMFPEEREDLMELVRAVDWVADWSKEAGRILAIIPFEKAPNDLKQVVLSMCRANIDSVKILSDCIKTLPKNPREAIDLANKVEMLEETQDELYSEARIHLVNLEYTGFTRGAFILLNMFLDALETISDWCENTADLVRAIAVRSL